MKKLLIFLPVLIFAASTFGQTPTPTPTYTLADLDAIEAKAAKADAEFKAKQKESIFMPPLDEPNPEPAGWKYIIGNTATKWYYKTWRSNKAGDAEVWLKVVSPSLRKAAPKKGPYSNLQRLSYVLQFVVFHCGDKRMSVEKFLFYDRLGNPLGEMPTFLARTYREPISPESMNEGLWEYFCDE